MAQEWIDIEISDISEVFLGKTPKKSDYTNSGNYKIIKFRDVSYQGICWSTNDQGFVLESKISDLKELQKNDILITSSAHSSAHIGKKITYVKALPSQFSKVFFVGELLNIRVNSKFANFKLAYYYFLSQTAYKHIQDLVKGVHLTSGEAKKIPYFIIPILEQNAIVAKIEELFSELDNGIENLKTALAKLKIYRNAVVKKAFDEIDAPIYKIPDVLHKVQIGPFGSQLHKSDYIQDGIPLINPMHIKNGKIVADFSYSIAIEKRDSLPNYILQAGDVIMGRRGEMGRCGLVTEHESGWFCGTGSLYFRPKLDIVYSTYLYYYLSSATVKELLTGKASGTTMDNLNKKIIYTLPIPLPDINRQHQVVQEIESRLSVCDKIEETITNSLAKAESLRQSILKKAFEGNLLTSQELEAIRNHPDYESAEELLKRIKQERKQS